MEVKLQMPPITAMAAPAERLVVITAETSQVTEGDPDYGGWTVFTSICPVLALHYFGEEGEDEPWYEAVFVTDYGQILNTRCLHDRCDAEIVHCPWPKAEDAERLKEHVERLREKHREYIQTLVGKGEPAYYDSTSEGSPRRRAAEPGEPGETNGHS